MGIGAAPDGAALRIAVAHPTYWPEVRRGAERFAHDLAAGLAGRGHAVRLVTTHRGPTTRTSEDGFEVVRLRRPPDARLRRRMFEDHLASAAVTGLELRRSDDEAVIALQAPDAYAALLAGRPTVYAFMGTPHRAWLTSRRARLGIVQRVVREAAAVTALSRHAADGFVRWLGVEAQVIHPGVDLRRFSPGGERHEHPTIICASASEEPRKRIPLLLDAFALVRRERPTARLVLMGKPSQPRERSGSGDGVEWHDPGAFDLVAGYREAWVSVLPSWGEAFGLVLAEALACGTRVVGSNREGIPEVLDGSDAVGALFEGDEPAALARTLLETLDRPPDPQGCRRHVEERFSLERTVAAYEALCASI